MIENVSQAIRTLLVPLPCMFSDSRFAAPMDAVKQIVSKVNNDLPASAQNAMNNFVTELEEQNLFEPDQIIAFWRNKLAGQEGF